MRNGYGLLLVALLMVGTARGERILFRTSTNYVTTGKVLGGAAVSDTMFTTNVQEIAGLEISIRSDTPGSVLWANSRSFGVNAATNTDEVARFELGEKVILSFNKDVEITYFDFRNFESGESFHFAVSNQPVFTIHHDAQDSTRSDYISTNLFIAADTEVGLYVTTTGNVGFEGLDVTVKENVAPVSLSLISSNGVPYVLVNVTAATSDAYVLQSSTNLTTNVWTTISASFAESTNWMVSATNDAAYIRAVVE